MNTLKEMLRLMQTFNLSRYTHSILNFCNLYFGSLNNNVFKTEIGFDPPVTVTVQCIPL